MSIAENVARVRERMSAACARARRSPNDVRLMAVSKTHPASAIREAFAAGVTLFGENRVQEFAEKSGELGGIAAEIHLIGHLQSNKTTKAAELFDAVDSVDSTKLAERLDSAAEKLGKTLTILLEVNVGGEEAKSGFAPDSEELRSLLAKANELPHLQFRGLMTIPPHTEDPNGARPYFQTLRAVRDRLAKEFPHTDLYELSIGMSHDYEVAIEEGSTCVRVGTGIFGERPPR
jgi:pyridoxal phosphate enzyme (YggS family)